MMPNEIAMRIRRMIDRFLGNVAGYDHITTDRNHLFLIFSDHGQAYAFLQSLEKEFDIIFDDKDLVPKVFIDFDNLVQCIGGYLKSTEGNL